MENAHRAFDPAGPFQRDYPDMLTCKEAWEVRYYWIHYYVFKNMNKNLAGDGLDNWWDMHMAV